jgi:hypothetical protein
MLMVLSRPAVILGLILANCSTLFAQGAANDSKLAFVIPNLFGPNGLRLDNPGHDAHFDSSFQANFGPFNSALATQLTSLPIPSPASGFTYSFDSALGVYNRSAQSFGPILTLLRLQFPALQLSRHRRRGPRELSSCIHA